MAEKQPLLQKSHSADDDDAEEETFYVLVTGTNSGLGFAICCRLIDDFLRLYPPNATLELIFTTRSRHKSDKAAAGLQKHIENALRKRQSRSVQASWLGSSIFPSFSRSQQDDQAAADPPVKPRIRLHPELVDLSSIVSVQHLAQRLRADIPRLHAAILNAAVGGFLGIDYLNALWTVLTDFVYALTFPTMIKMGIGLLASRQIGDGAVGSDGPEDGTKQSSLGEKAARVKEKVEADEPPLGAVFAANVFGHYLLTHYLMPLLSAAESYSQSISSKKVDGTPNGTAGSHGDSRGGRVIWLSSIEAYAHSLDLAQDDLQGLHHHLAYHSSKRLTDALVLTSELPSSRPYVDAYLAIDKPTMNGHPKSQKPDAQDVDGPRLHHPSTTEKHRPSLYVAHPGICSTSIMPLPPPLGIFMIVAFWLARLLGSPWHTTSSYAGAAAPVWLALASQAELDDFEQGGRRKGKWGSAVAFGKGGAGLGGDDDGRKGRKGYVHEGVVVRRTEVEGWGWSGVVGEADEWKIMEKGTRSGRRRDAKDLTPEAKEEFEELGRRCWEEMERLRREWEGRIEDAGLGIGLD